MQSQGGTRLMSTSPTAVVYLVLVRLRLAWSGPRLSSPSNVQLLRSIEGAILSCTRVRRRSAAPGQSELRESCTHPENARRDPAGATCRPRWDVVVCRMLRKDFRHQRDRLSDEGVC